MNGVKKLIRAKTTKRFLTKDGRWTDDLARAWSFRDTAEAHGARTKLQLLDVEIYYAFEEDRACEYDFTLPLLEANGLEARLEGTPPANVRILLPRGQEYLQPSGEWGQARATAREFVTPLLAYWWAKEQQLLGVEVVMADTNGQSEFVPLRV